MIMTTVMVETTKALHGAGPHFLTIVMENLLAAYGKAEYEVTLSCWGMHELAWRIKRALRKPDSTCITIGSGCAKRIAEFLAPEPSGQTHFPQKITIYCPCGQDHILTIKNHPWKGRFSVCFGERKPSKLLWRLRDALWPKDYSLCEILLTAEQAARLAAFLRRWIKDV